MQKAFDIEEKEILLRMKNGDKMAFEIIYHRYKTRIAVKLFAVLKVDELVEDTLQELFYRVWEKRSSIDPHQNVAGYLYRIATNLALDYLRKESMKQKLLEPLGLENDVLKIYQKEFDQALFDLIDRLPEQRKRVFMLCKFENKSYEEVAVMLGISSHAVKDHIVKANKFLKSNFNELTPWLGYCMLVYALTDFL